MNASVLDRSAWALAASALALAASAWALAATASACRRAARSARIIACAAARSVGSDSRAVTPTMESHPSPSARKKALSHRCRPPRLLRMSPINARQQVTELRRRDRHHPIRRRWPQKASPFQTLREQARTLAVVPDHLQQVAAASPEAKQMSAQRVAAQHLLHLEGQARKALPHVGVPSGQPYPYAGRNWNHRRRLVLASALST